MRHESRRGFRLVRVAASGSCLSVLTGLVGTGPSRAGGRADAHAHGGSGSETGQDVETGGVRPAQEHRLCLDRA